MNRILYVGRPVGTFVGGRAPRQYCANTRPSHYHATHWRPAEAKSKAAKAAAEKAALAAAKAATAEAAAKRRRIGAGGAALVARLEAEAAAKAAAKATAMAELQRRLRRAPPPLAIYRTPRCMYSMHLCK